MTTPHPDAEPLSAALARYAACDPTESYEGKTADAYRLADEVKGLVDMCRKVLDYLEFGKQHDTYQRLSAELAKWEAR